MDRCFYKTSTYDPLSSLPIYVLDSTFFPINIIENFDQNDVDFQLFSQNLLNLFPKEPFSLIFFTNGFYKYDSSSFASSSTMKLPINLIKFLKFIPVETKQKMSKIYIVHGSWLLKSIVEILKKFWGFTSGSSNFIHCENLTELSTHVDITKIPISLHTYIIDQVQYNNNIILNRHLSPLYSQPITLSSNLPLTQFSRIYNNLIGYLTNKNLDIELSSNDWETILKCSNLSDETKIAVDILSKCLKRDQLIVLSDYSFLEHYMIIIKFLIRLATSNAPLIPQESIINEKINFETVEDVTQLLNKILLFKHKNSDQLYDNAYIIIKIIKLMHHLLLKLERETNIIEPNAKNLGKSKERQKLRLILAFTKVIYSEGDEDDSLGFDLLFKFLKGVLDNYQQVKILATEYTIDDFNNFINFDDFLAFEKFKNKQIGNENINELITKDSNYNNNDNFNENENENENENKKQTHEPPLSPIKSKINSQKGNDQKRPPTPPMPRKIKLLSIEGDKANETIKVSQNTLSRLADAVEDLGIEDNSTCGSVESFTSIDSFSNDVKNFKTPTKPFKPIELRTPATPSTLTDNISPPVTPTPTSNNSILWPSKHPMTSVQKKKYTEKDKILAEQAKNKLQEQEAMNKRHKEVEKGVNRGERKVSRLARLYEEKLLGH
ncbi:Ecm25 protein [Martiniozyma asiatica (nom. inval.)]|nr:Ecm25 protein [Martiniozyma asiatica]